MIWDIDNYRLNTFKRFLKMLALLALHVISFERNKGVSKGRINK